MKIARFFILTVLFLFSVSGFAEESWYQVEIVVFERPAPDLDGEKWLLTDYEPRTNLIELLPEEEVISSDNLIPFTLLPAARNRLSGTYQAFKLSSNYQPLIHYSWQQPATERRESRFVHIQKLTETATPELIETETIPTDEEPAFIEDLIPPDRIIDGAIRVRSGFYLHVDVDLTYFTALPEENRIMPVTLEPVEIDPFAKFPIQLKETRKIKLNEIHYFDHPMFGLMIQVSRL